MGGLCLASGLGGRRGFHDVVLRIGEDDFAIALKVALGAAGVRFPGGIGAGAVGGLAVRNGIREVLAVEHLASLTHLSDVAAGIHAALLHHGFDLGATCGGHVLQALGHVGGLLSIGFALDMNLPQPGLHGSGLGVGGEGAKREGAEVDRAAKVGLHGDFLLGRGAWGDA